MSETTEQASEKAAEQVAEQSAEPAAEQAAEPAIEQAAKPAAAEAAEPAAEPAAEQAAEPAAEQAAEQTPEGQQNVSIYRELIQVMRDQSSIERSLRELGERIEARNRRYSQDTVEINGIPSERRQDLRMVFFMLCINISCELREKDVISIERMPEYYPGPVHVRLSNKAVRDRFLASALKFREKNGRHMNSHDLRFEGMQIPILFSEHPSKLNEIHREKVKKALRCDHLRLKLSFRKVSTVVQPASTSVTNVDNVDNQAQQTINAEPLEPGSVSSKADTGDTNVDSVDDQAQQTINAELQKLESVSSKADTGDTNVDSVAILAQQTINAEPQELESVNSRADTLETPMSQE